MSNPKATIKIYSSPSIGTLEFTCTVDGTPQQVKDGIKRLFAENLNHLCVVEKGIITLLPPEIFKSKVVTIEEA